MLHYKEHHAYKTTIVEIHMLYLLHTRSDKVQNKDILAKLGIAHIEEKMQENTYIVWSYVT